MTTHWSVVLAARTNDSPQAAQALEILCRTYWYPLYAYVRRWGHEPADAEDLTQEFFSQLLAKERLRHVDPALGKFRTFLLTSMRNFLSNEWDKNQAQKRGGGKGLIPLDEEGVERRFLNNSLSGGSPERQFDRDWALTLLDRSLLLLAEEAASKGTTAVFERLKSFLLSEPGDGDYEAIARDLGISKGNIGVAVHRLRKRYRELVRSEVANTVADDSDVDAEVKYLLMVMVS